MNHVVLYVRDCDVHKAFYEDLLGFRSMIHIPGQFAFLQAPNSENHHDIAFFTIGSGAGPSAAGTQTVGMYHLAWEVATLPELAEMRDRLNEAGVLKGASDHGVNKSLYCMDPDGLEFEVMWLVPPNRWGSDAHEAIVRPLDLEADLVRFADLLDTPT